MCPDLPIADAAPGSAAPEYPSHPFDYPAVIRRPSYFARNLGAVSAVWSAIFVALEIVAIVLASNGLWAVATALAWAVIVLTVASFLVGASAVILRRKRRLGILAMILSLVANPLVLIAVLDAVGPTA